MCPLDRHRSTLVDVSLPQFKIPTRAAGHKPQRGSCARLPLSPAWSPLLSSQLSATMKLLFPLLDRAILPRRMAFEIRGAAPRERMSSKNGRKKVTDALKAIGRCVSFFRSCKQWVTSHCWKTPLRCSLQQHSQRTDLIREPNFKINTTC